MPLENTDRSVTIRNDITGLGMAIFAGLTEGLRAVGLQTRLLELIAGLRLVMDEPNLAKRWLEGEPTFVEAEVASAETIESLHRALVEDLKEQWDKPGGEDLGPETNLILEEKDAKAEFRS